MYWDKVTSIFLNITNVSRLVYNITVIAFVFFVGFVLPDGEVNSIFNTLAVLQASSSFMSFGFGANIIKPLLEKEKKDRNNMILHIIIIKIILVAFAAFLIYFFDILDQNVFVIFLVLMGCVWAFTDIYVESMSRRLYKKYFLTKAFVAVIALIVKLLLVYTNFEILNYVLTVEGIFPLFFLIFTHDISLLSFKNTSKNYFKEVYNLIVYGKFIWLSSVLQLTGSRILYLFINQSVPINLSVLYFILLRLVEGLTFIPNDICGRFFSRILLEKNNQIKRDELRYQMLRTCLTSALLVSPGLFAILYIYLRIKDSLIDNYLVLLPLSFAILLFSFLRIWISREIILNENLIASPVSYIVSFLITIGSIYLMPKYDIWIITCLLIYYMTSSFIPFVVNKTKMNSTFMIFKKLSHGQT